MLNDAGNGPSAPAPKRPALKPAPAPKQAAAPAPKTRNTLADWMRPQGTKSVVDYSQPDQAKEWMMGQGQMQMERQKADMAADAESARAEREKVLGITTGALTTTPELIKDQLHQLTADEYNHMTPRQRAAVDYNTMLSTAVRKDLKRQGKYDKTVSPEQRATYDESVKNMFGDHGSDIYAPETMAVLRQLKIDDKTDDLDDYLNLKVTLTDDDITNITDHQPAPNYVIDGRVPEASRGKLEVVEGLVDKTQSMQQQLAKGKQMLQSFLATAASERSQDLGHLGGSSPLASRPSLGFQAPQFTESGAPNDLNTYFRTAFDALADEKNAGDRPKILNSLKVDLHPDELQAFMDYASTRVQNSQQYGAVLGDGKPDTQYARPKELRKLLGLEK